MFFQKRKKTKIGNENLNSEIKKYENILRIEENVYCIFFNELTITEKNTTWTIDEEGTNELIQNPEKKNLLENNKLLSPDFQIYEWLKLSGEFVKKDQPILFIQKGNPELYECVFKKVWIGEAIIAPTDGILKYHFQVGDSIKNNDKLFSIISTTDFQKINHPSNESYKYLFNRYDIPQELRVKTKDIWHPDDKPIYILSWLIKNGEFVNKGIPILKIKCGNLVETYFEYDLLSKTSGYIDLIKNDNHEYPTIYGKINQNEHIYSIYKSKDRKYYNKPIVNYDAFNKEKIIKWEVVGGLERPFGIETYNPIGGIHVLFDNNCSLIFAFNNYSGKDYIKFFFFSNEIKLSKKDKISFLFENDELLSFEINESIIKSNLPWKYLREFKIPITLNEIKIFRNQELIKWRIDFVKSNSNLQGSTTNTWYENEDFKIVVNNLTKEYERLVEEEIENYKPVEEKLIEEKITVIDKCFVYLMIDKTNDFHKIGISNNPDYREKTLQSEKPTIELVCAKEFPSRKIAESIEKALHETFSNKRIRGEWFELESQDIDEIKQTLK
ncbi:GIY-YIG nuclease family protein [Aestuariivivens sediminicola]|uniref:GIY-YIG nuclease family protein n=1 Tax=Aestuariivivens sediminicola TaxID=2913560 RepID=UPI001F58CA08|nr:GIY-YIG nuclease family protein [Aestuariivivens sediminicola]